MERHEFEQYFSKDGNSLYVEDDKANVEYDAATPKDAAQVREFAALVTESIDNKLSGFEEEEGKCVFRLEQDGKSTSLTVSYRADGTFSAVKSVDEHAKSL